jgi:hypothetical protein
MLTDHEDAPLGAEAFPLFASGLLPLDDADDWNVTDEREELRELGRMLGFDC